MIRYNKDTRTFSSDLIYCSPDTLRNFRDKYKTPSPFNRNKSEFPEVFSREYDDKSDWYLINLESFALPRSSKEESSIKNALIRLSNSSDSDIICITKKGLLSAPMVLINPTKLYDIYEEYGLTNNSDRSFSEGQFDSWMKQMKYPGDALRGMIRDIRRYPGYDRELMLKLLSSELHRVLVFSKDLILRKPIDMSRISKMLKLNQEKSEELQKSSDKFTKDCKKAIAKDSHKEFNTAINNFATVLISLV